ncbi:MAG: hypothetical protein ABSC53_03055 [Bacteroidota bacterium]|jgi:predicted SAM-dependent methyltransferase
MNAIRKTVKELIRTIGFEVHPIYKGMKKFDEKAFSELCKTNLFQLNEHRIQKIHYGCGPNLFGDHWINVDIADKQPELGKVYSAVNLIRKHPFPSNFFLYGFSEDFLEHLDQSEALIFLSEAFRTLHPCGVLRLTFPGLRGILKKHYKSGDFEGAAIGQSDAYTHWEHKHFFCEESLSIVAKHIGFSEITFYEYGKSKHQELMNLETRINQKDINIYAELKK